MLETIIKIARRLKPARCPQCGAILRFLDYEDKEIRIAHYDLEGYYDWDTADIIESKFYCPECNSMLFQSEREAEKFLRGES